MRLLIPAAALLLLLGGGSTAAAEPAKAEQDIWETVFARDRAGNDQQIGYSHLKFETIDENGAKLIRSTRELRLTVKREGQLAKVSADIGTDEAADGKVVGVFMKQWLAEKQSLTMRGTVDPSGGTLKLSVESSTTRQMEKPWDSKVIGLHAESTLFHDKKVAAGDSFTYRYFEPTISSVVTVNVKVNDLEEVLLPRGGKKKLLAAVSKPEKIDDFQSPASQFWIDPKSLDVVMSRTEMPGFGVLTLLRSTREVAAGNLGDVPDLMRMQTIRLARGLARGEDVHELGSVTYRITIKGEGSPAKLVKTDDRQRIANVAGKSFDLIVESRRAPKRLAEQKEAPKEFLTSNHFINSDDPTVKKLAAAAVGKTENPWEKAKAIERWVRANMTPENYTEAMATADHVAKTLSGDCTEYAMLTAAMCKAQGIPARTALGLLYVFDEREGPSLAFHMWTEVYVMGQWLGLDSTRGRGFVGPGHIKITDHSWHDTEDFKPLLPVTTFLLAKPAIEVKAAVRQ